MIGYAIGYMNEDGITFFAKNNKAKYLLEDFSNDVDRAFVYTEQGIKVLNSISNHAIQTICRHGFDVIFFEVEKTVKVLGSKVKVFHN
jgi:hypothetical protein